MVVAMPREPRSAPPPWRRLAAMFCFMLGIALPASAGAHDGPAAAAVAHGPSPVVVRMHGMIGRARLGVGVVEMTPELRRFFGAPQGAGILVGRVEDDSPAKAGGIKVGDVLVAVGDDEIENAGDVQAALGDRDDGEKVTVVLVRNKKKLRMKITVKGREGEEMEWFVPPRPPDAPEPPGRAFAPGAKTKLLEKELERTRKQLREIEKRLDKLEQKSKRKD
jgi:membrane-associated protease RseP (regulator of RpoE activity)